MYFELLKKDFFWHLEIKLHVLTVDTRMYSNVIIALSRLQLFCRGRIITNDNYFDVLVDIMVTRVTFHLILHDISDSTRNFTN
jgi:hypothetical protein